MSNLSELKRIAAEGGADVSNVTCNEEALALIGGSGSGGGGAVYVDCGSTGVFLNDNPLSYNDIMAYVQSGRCVVGVRFGGNKHTFLRLQQMYGNAGAEDEASEYSVTFVESGIEMYYTAETPSEALYRL